MIGMIIHNIVKHTTNTQNRDEILNTYDAYKAVYNEAIQTRKV